MIITWYGEGCFKCQSGELTLLSDPVDAKSGLSAPRFKPNVLIKTIAPVPAPVIEDEENTLVVQNAGEYDRFGIEVKGYAIKKESTDTYIKTVYVVEFEGIRLCFLGHLDGQLEGVDLEPLEYIDVLFIPGGGKPFIEQEKAVKLIHQIEPRVVIPSFFKIPGLKRNSADSKDFVKEFGVSKTDAQDKFTFKKKDLQEKGTSLVLLKA